MLVPTIQKTTNAYLDATMSTILVSGLVCIIMDNSKTNYIFFCVNTSNIGDIEWLFNYYQYETCV